MAKPQIEDGHTKIANEIVEALARVNLSAYESRVLWCVFRKTYGWHKKSDRISYTQFGELTGINRRHLGRTLRLLLARRMITCQGEGQQLEYSIQKDYEQWRDISRADLVATKPLPNGAIGSTESSVAQRGNSEPEINHCPTGAEPLPIGGELLPIGATKPLPNGAHTKAIKHLTKAFNKSKASPEILKEKHGEFENVLLSPDEYEKLVVKMGKPKADDLIEQLSTYMRQNPANARRYRDHYATILNWSRRDERRDDGKTGRNPRALPARYTRPEDYGRV